MSGSLTRGGGKNVPGIPGACVPTILRIWQEAHWDCHRFSANDLAQKVTHKVPTTGGSTSKNLTSIWN